MFEHNLWPPSDGSLSSADIEATPRNQTKIKARKIKTCAEALVATHYREDFTDFVQARY